ncbi:MAG: sigma-70 family RNA polymerase sigma factor [Ruminococcus sp.]|nr:sigma-70 family RNA polymerase sigma factor [Ruminococcus sp.]
MNGKKHYSYTELTDEQLVGISEGDMDSLGEIVRRYLPRIRYFSRTFPESVRDDLVQEGLIALLGAVKSYEADKGAEFATYASICVKNRMASAFKRNALITEDEGTLGEQIDAETEHPEDIVIEKENTAELYDAIATQLSELEWNVFRLLMMAMSYSQIAEELGVSQKAVDNAVQRARRKLRLIL